MEPSHSRSVLLTLSLLLLLFQALAQNPENGTQTDQTSEASTTGSAGAVEDAIKPFYTMTNTFLDLVHPTSREWILDNAVVSSYLNSSLTRKDLSIFYDQWKKNTKNYIGFIVCVAVGVLFVVAMPIAGLILFCCRCCCGNCGANAEDEPDKDNRCARFGCGVLLLIFTTFILAGTILLFFTNEYLWEQTAHEDRGILHETDIALQSFESYKKNAKADYTGLGGDINTRVDKTVNEVKRLPISVADDFAQSINVTKVLNYARQLQTSAQSIETNLGKVKDTLEELQNHGNLLGDQLYDIGTRMRDTLGSCPPSAESHCDNLYSKASSLQQVANFSKVTSITSFLEELRRVDLSNIYDKGKEEYDKVKNEIDAKMQSQMDEIDNVGKTIKDDVNNIVSEVRGNIDKIQFGNYSVKPYMAQVQEYGNYRKYGGIAVGCALVITAALFYLGLMFGCCGSDPDTETGCNKATGANLLMGGIVWAFLFSWILMLIVIVLFVSGGLLYTEGCRHFVDLGESPESQRALETLDRLLKNDALDAEGLSLSVIVERCRAGQAAYTAFNLDNYIDIDEKISLDKYDLEKVLEEIKGIQITIPEVDIISDENSQQLTDLRNANLQNIDFDSFYTQLQYDITSENLVTLAGDADEVAKSIKKGGDITKANTVERQAEDLRKIHRDIVEPIIEKKNELEGYVRKLEILIKGPSKDMIFSEHVANLQDAFLELQQTLDAKRADNTALTEEIREKAREIYNSTAEFLELVKEKVKYRLANCKPLYEQIDGLITVTFCGRFIQPYNALWFSLGWCLFFFIPCIIAAWSLNIQYRRISDYEPAEKGFEDPNYLF